MGFSYAFGACVCVCVCVCVLLGPYPQQMEVPRRAEESKLQLLAYTTATATGIWAASATYATAHSNVRSLNRWARPGIKPVSLWILVRFVFAEPQWELQYYTL